MRLHGSLRWLTAALNVLIIVLAGLAGALAVLLASSPACPLPELHLGAHCTRPAAGPVRSPSSSAG